MGPSPWRPQNRRELKRPFSASWGSPGASHRARRDLQRQGRQHHALRGVCRDPSRQGRAGAYLGAFEDPAIRINRVEDVLSVGDEIVMVTEVAPNGKVSLSRRAALTGQLPEPKPERPPRRDDDRGDRGPRRDDRGFRGAPEVGRWPPRQQDLPPGGGSLRAWGQPPPTHESRRSGLEPARSMSCRPAPKGAGPPICVE